MDQLLEYSLGDDLSTGAYHRDKASKMSPVSELRSIDVSISLPMTAGGRLLACFSYYPSQPFRLPTSRHIADAPHEQVLPGSAFFNPTLFG